MASAIIVEDVWKRFRLGNATPNGDLRERFSRRFAKGPVESPEFWALKGVSFSVEQGGSLGIVGHNGSGKSTMLKILTDILRPTRGRIQTKGRVGALIEVGAGFHQDLTGRENIYLNASILGLSRREITRRFDDIVAFSELERFIDTPVKRYSTGMYMRLGFSVIAHTTPDILIIDEVLAVGDASFQEKCISRIREVAAQGATVIFVSHSMMAVSKLCSHAILLDRGETVSYGATEKVVQEYGQHMTERIAARYLADDEKAAASLALTLSTEAADAETSETGTVSGEADGVTESGKAEPDTGAAAAKANDGVHIKRVELLDAEQKVRRAFQAGDALTIRIEYAAPRDVKDCIVGVGLNRVDGLVCYGPNTRTDNLLLSVPAGEGHFDITFDPLNLLADTYTIAVALLEGDTLLEYRDNLCRFLVSDKIGERGVIRIPHQWTHFANGHLLPPQLNQKTVDSQEDLLAGTRSE